MATEQNARLRLIRPSQRVGVKDLWEFWAYRELVFMFVRRDIVTRYRQTLIGPIWLWLQAIFMTGAITLVGQITFGNRSNGLSAVIFTMLGYIVWSYSNQTIAHVGNLFHSRGQLFSRIYFPRLVVPIASSISQLLGLVIQYFVAILLIFIALFVPQTTIRPIGFFAIIPGLAIMVPFCLGIGLLIACASAKYRDLSNATPFLLQFLLFVTPVLYGFGDVDPSLRGLYAVLNPLSVVSDMFRACIVPMASTGTEIALAVISSFVVSATGVLWFQRLQRTVVDIL